MNIGFVRKEKDGTYQIVFPGDVSRKKIMKLKQIGDIKIKLLPDEIIIIMPRKEIEEIKDMLYSINEIEPELIIDAQTVDQI